jgi:hypothetical protein
MDPQPIGVNPHQETRRTSPRAGAVLVALAALTGLGLLADSLWRGSATYDEVFYLSVAARWWRTGDQTRITRAGSPLTFWKLQQVPMLWSLDQLGYGSWIDDPGRFEAKLLPWARTSALAVWLLALILVAVWSHRLYGPRAMILAAWWFALSPNLLAHGALITMETPIVAAMTGLVWLFWFLLQSGDRRAFFASAVLGGLALSCKFTAVLALPILGLLWFLNRWWEGDRRFVRIVLTVTGGMIAFATIMAVSNIVVTGGALLPISERTGTHPSIDGKLGPGLSGWIGRLVETPIPQDWVGFARQVQLQHSGAPSYLLGERRDKGWVIYYLVALAVKVPLTFWPILVARAAWTRRIPSAGRDWVLPIGIIAFLAIASLGSSRNFGLRYLLPLAPLSIVWISGLAESDRWLRRLVWAGLIGQVLAVASIHPYELSYFNALAGGSIGGRRILADSNLDWSQGLKPLAHLQREHPEYRDLTLYYFGDTDPARYGVAGRSYTIRATNPEIPSKLSADTTYLAVSASLQWGPWGPRGFFRALDHLEPVRFTDDTTIAIYRTASVTTIPRDPPIKVPAKQAVANPGSALLLPRDDRSLPAADD